MKEGVTSMPKALTSEKQFYSEAEAARHLNISVAHLHALLDQHVFNDGSTRPEGLTFCDTDLVLLGFWSQASEVQNVISMPSRGVDKP